MSRTPAARARRRLWFGLWRRSLPRQRWRLQTLVGITSWALVLVIAGYTHTQSGRLPFSASLQAKTALAATAAGTSVAQLASGPTGQLLPPGTLAPYRTYRNSYSPGQCTWYVASRRPIPAGWGNARNWYGHAAAAGWGVGPTPAVGAVAWTSAGYYGHVALVEQVDGARVLITEMNYYGPYRIDERWVSAASFRYIY